MSKLRWSFEFFSREGIKFLFLELIIVFFGVYGAFLFQSYSENRKIDSEREKILIGLKEDLEYFRIYFPDFAGYPTVQEWNETYAEDKYINFSGWRFLQPQYDYIAIEYALTADAEVIDYELNSVLAEIYQELQKLEHVEQLLTELAMKYQAIPPGRENETAVLMARQNNMLNFRRFTDRYQDRAGIMTRIAEMSAEQLPDINVQFDPRQLREIELQLIQKNIVARTEEELNFYIGVLSEFFPNLTKEELREVLQ